MSLQRPPLFQMHAAAGADFTDFNGWEMPVQFESIQAEHAAVRDGVGIFDISHMSQVRVEGRDATKIMNHLTTNDVRDLDGGDAQYSCILRRDGVILDDIVVYRYPNGNGYLFVPNAGHGEQMVDRWSDFASKLGLSVSITDQTNTTGMVAVQGPESTENISTLTRDRVTGLSQFTWKQTELAEIECLVARTGYTGEDGFEIIFPAADSRMVWNSFDGIQPCGLGARNTLRLEAGLLLSGQDFDPEEEPRTPLEAGLEFVVDFSKDDFVGQDSLRDLQSEGVSEHLVGIKIEERGIARQGYPILENGTEIGHVTSGTMSPTFDAPLALGFVKTKFAKEGTRVQVEIRGRSVDATIVGHRFLQNARKRLTE